MHLPAQPVPVSKAVTSAQMQAMQNAAAAFWNACTSSASCHHQKPDAHRQQFKIQCCAESTEEGLKLLKKKFDEVLKNLEVEEVNPEGEVFDPLIAEAVMQVEKSEGEESERVKQVFQKGYKYKEKIIRYAKVSVIK